MVSLAPGAWVMFDGSPEDAPRLFPAPVRPLDRRRLILEEASRLQDLAGYEEFMIPFRKADLDLRDAYRDMAAALRLLADERGT